MNLVDWLNSVAAGVAEILGPPPSPRSKPRRRKSPRAKAQTSADGGGRARRTGAPARPLPEADSQIRESANPVCSNECEKQEPPRKLECAYCSRTTFRDAADLAHHQAKVCRFRPRPELAPVPVELPPAQPPAPRRFVKVALPERGPSKAIPIEGLGETLDPTLAFADEDARRRAELEEEITAENAAKKRLQVTCKGCGDPFFAHSDRREYCAPCIRKRDSEQHLRATAAKRAAAPEASSP